MNTEQRGQKSPRLSNKQLRRLHSSEKQEQIKTGSFLWRKFTELNLAMRITLSVLASGSVAGAGIFAYDHFINPSHSINVGTTDTYEAGIKNELANIKDDATNSRIDYKSTALRLGNLAAIYVCHELNPEIECDPKKLADRMHIQNSDEFRATFYGRATCDRPQSVDMPPAYTDALTQDMYFDLGYLTKIPIPTAWQGFVHETIHANTELKELDTPTQVSNVLSNASAIATKQRGLRAYVHRPELNANSRECYDTHPNLLEEAVVVDTKRRMMEKLGFQNYESPEYQRVGSNYSKFVVDNLFGGNYKTPLIFDQTSQAIPFYREIGIRTSAPLDRALNAGEIYLSKAVFEGLQP